MDRKIVVLFIVVLAGVVWPGSPQSVRAAGVVGDGTPASCTEAEFQARLAGGGTVTFNCGPSPVIITLTRTSMIATDTHIDGGDLITLRADDVRVFYVESGVNFTLDNLTVARGLATSGSAIFNNGGTVHITHTTFYYNVARSMRGVDDDNAGRGGAIFNLDGEVYVDGGRFLFNQAWDYGGGGIYNEGGVLIIRGSLFALNYAPSLGWTAGGGAIFNHQDGIADISGSAFVFNVAYNGGAIYNNETTRMSVAGGSRFIVNVTPWSSGGAVYSSGTLDALGSSFTMNYARIKGGAIAFFPPSDTTDGVLNVNGSTFERNRALFDDGGAIYMRNGTGSVAGTTFRHNRARNGGALALRDAEVKVLNTRFENNTANELGGGVFISGDQDGYPGSEASSYTGQLTLTWVTLTGNHARSGGGLGVDDAFVLVDRSLFARNDALNKGGGIFNGGHDTITSIISRGWIDVVNTTFSFNHAIYGGAIALAGDSDLYPRRVSLVSVDMAYVTFYGNGADDAGESLFGPDFRGRWVIFGDTLNGRDNCSEPIFDVEEYYGIEFPRVSCGGYERVDPLLGPLANNGGLTQTHALLPDSPAKDRVSPALDDRCATGYRDQRDFPRPGVSTTWNSPWCDYGAYEEGDPVNMTSAPLTQATPEPSVVFLTPTPVPTETSQFAPQCGNFTVLAPRDGLANGQQAFYWEPAPDAMSYQLLIYDADTGTLLTSVDIPAPATSATIDVSSSVIGGSFHIRYELHALYNGQIFCTDVVNLLREAPAPIPGLPEQPSQPICGNGICEQDENPNNCQVDCP